MEGTATNKTNETDTRECSLFKLPPELRLIIYQEVLSSFVIIKLETEEGNVIARPTLLGTCVLIRHEACQTYMDRLCTILLEMRQQYDSIQAEADRLREKAEQGGQTAEKELVIRKQVRDSFGRCKDHLNLERKYLKLVVTELESWDRAGFRFKDTQAWRALEEATL